MEMIVPRPSYDHKGNPYPTLGPQVCQFLEDNFVYGPGVLKGQPYKVRNDIRYILYRAYEHYPEGHIIDHGEGQVENKTGRRHFQYVNVSLPKGSAKCLAPGTELILESGERVQAEDLEPGDRVMSYDSGQVTHEHVVAVEEQPVAPMYEVLTEHGRKITVSEGHPFLVSGTQWRDWMPKYHKYTANDPKRGETSWSKVEDLHPGDRLVPALDWKTGGDKEDQDLGWLLGVLAGDAVGDGRFTNNDPEIVEKVSHYFDLTPLKDSPGDWYMRGSRDFLREHGLFGKNAYGKRVPESVMQGNREMVLGYLAGLLDTDGCTIYAKRGNKTIRSCDWYSVSEENMRDVQTLLASVGFNSDVRIKMSTYKGQPYTSWTVVVSNKADLDRLARTLPVVRQRNLDHFKKYLNPGARGAYGDVNLDKVKSVTYVGDGVTIGVEVENTHVHVTNGLVTHNTEIMALVALLELHPDAPVRFNGYDPNAEGGLAPGRSVVSPFIPMLAPTKEQLKDLGYGAVTAIAQEVDPDGALFDVTLERVMLVGESESKIVPVAASDSRLDGQKPTFQAIDESHHLHEDRHLAAYRTLVNNLPKRREDDAWQMTCTTAGDPTEPSVALAQYKTGEKMAKGEIEKPNTFFYHRGTSDENAVFDTMAQRLRALKEASGEEVAQMRDLSVVAQMWDSEENDKSYLERVWCNRWIESTSTAFDIQTFRDLGDPNLVIPAGATVTLGFDGAVTRDSTALVVTDVKTGVQNLLGLWERPEKAKDWSVPVSEVNAMVEFCMETYDVFSFYYDPPYWQEAGAMWDERWPGKVIEWPTRNLNRIYYAVRAYQEAIANGEIGHNGDQDFERHIANAGKNEVNSMDEEGRKKFRLAKIAEHRKFDAAMAAVLSWQARLDAIKKGARSSSGYISVPQKIR